MSLGRLLASEQRSFLRRGRGAWGEHLFRARAFLGEGLHAAPADAPLLVLGAGSGLELPWEEAGSRAVAWDGDPLSRARTFLRHGRWLPWVFEDLTGGLEELERTARRCMARPDGGRRHPLQAATRLAGLLPSMNPSPVALRTWIAEHHPGAILAANVMGQFGSVARSVVEAAFGFSPWQQDPEVPDPLAEAMDRWTARALRAFLGALKESGAPLWLLHDRAVLFGDPHVELGPFQPAWREQVRTSDGCLEVMDPLCGVDPVAELELREPFSGQRWLWPLGPGQLHLVEALHRPVTPITSVEPEPRVRQNPCSTNGGTGR